MTIRSVFFPFPLLWLAALALMVGAPGVNLEIAGGSECWQQPDERESPASATRQADVDIAHTKQVRQRLVRVDIIVISLLCLLAVLFGYLRLDHATRGFYSGRLQTLALVAAAVVLVVAYLAWTAWLRP